MVHIPYRDRFITIMSELSPFAPFTTPAALQQLTTFEKTVRIKVGATTSVSTTSLENHRKINDDHDDHDNDDDNDDDVSKLSWTDIHFSTPSPIVLGKGSFSCVYRAQVIFPSRESNDDDDDDDDDDGRFPNNSTYYAIKCLNDKVLRNEDEFVIGAIDLAHEAYLLRQLDHENIIRLHAIPSLGISESFQQQRKSTNGHPWGYFLVLDILQETLKDRLERWRQHPSRWMTRRPSSTSSFMSSMISRRARNQDSSSLERRTIHTTRRETANNNSSNNGHDYSPDNSRPRHRSPPTRSTSLNLRRGVVRRTNSCQSLRRTATTTTRTTTNPNGETIQDMRERVRPIALGIVNAMEYLHRHRIILRDLKPNNIGFDKDDGRVKLFDFGLARRIDQVVEGEMAGTFRYMAPECMMNMTMLLGGGGGDGGAGDNNTMDVPCQGFASDVYSFGIVLWEVCTLEVPYERYAQDRDRLRKAVSHDHIRPSCDTIDCPGITELIKSCWDANPLIRPTFADLCQRIPNVLTTLEQEFQFPFQLKFQENKSSSSANSGGGGGIGDSTCCSSSSSSSSSEESMTLPLLASPPPSTRIAPSSSTTTTTSATTTSTIPTSIAIENSSSMSNHRRSRRRRKQQQQQQQPKHQPKHQGQGVIVGLSQSMHNFLTHRSHRSCSPRQGREGMPVSKPIKTGKTDGTNVDDTASTCLDDNMDSDDDRDGGFDCCSFHE